MCIRDSFNVAQNQKKYKCHQHKLLHTPPSPYLTYTSSGAVFNRPGYWHIPSHFDEEFCLKLTAEKGVRRYSKGIPRIEYIKIRPGNEALDLAVLDLAGFALMNVNNKRVQRRLEDVRKPEPEKPQFPQLVMKPKPSWTRRYR